MTNPAWEELAKLYLRVEGKVYRFKIFPKHIGIEQQPGGRNWLTDKDLNPDADIVYDPNTNTWDDAALHRLIEQYHLGVEDRLLSEE